MNSEDRQFNRRLSLLIFGSFFACATVVVLRLGLGATPYTAVDSLGRPMGFNDPLSLEHHLIMLRNFRPSDLLRWEHVYEWILAATHIAGFYLLAMGSRISTRIVRWYFAIQPIVFPFGIPAILVLPLITFGFIYGRGADREGFVDVPFIIVTAHPMWVLTSLYIAFALRGEGLGLRGAWKGFVGFWRAGAKAFVRAAR